MSFVDFPSRRFFLAFVMLALSWQTARAQEAINTKAATQPATGVLAFREQFRYTRYDRDPTGLPSSVTTKKGTTITVPPAEAATLQKCAYDAVREARRRLKQ